MTRVLLLNNVPAPYFDPLFEKLGDDSGWRLTVCYTSSWNRDVGWQAKEMRDRKAHRTIALDDLRPALKTRFGSSAAAAVALLQLLFRERPDYLICYGYTLKPQITLLAWAMITNTPFAVSGDANIHADSARGLKRRLKNFWLGLITRRAAALITIGTSNRMFWESYGARPGQLYEARFAVDNDFYSRAIEARKDDAVALREKWGLTGKAVFLFVGRLVKRKNVDLIIKAAQSLSGDRFAVLIAGAGEERAELERQANGDPRVIFAGGVDPADLPLYYAASDVLILPASQEPWGLVINEAMACGLAVIAHRRCGATVDLVDIDNGAALETFEVEELAGAMRRIIDDDDLRRTMKERSKEKIQSWSIDGAAHGIIRAVNATKKDPTQRRGETEKIM